MTDPEREKAGRSPSAFHLLKGVLTQPMDSYPGGLGRFAAGAARLVEAVVLLLAGVLIGAGVGFAWGWLTRGHRVLEQMLGGAAIGVIGAVFRVTRYRWALGAWVGALIGWNLAFSLSVFSLAPVAAILGGCLGPMLQRKLHGTPAVEPEKARSGRTVAWRILSVVGGLIGGGYVGGIAGSWLCMVVFFGAYLPSQLPRTLDQGGLAIFFFGLLGGLIGAVVGARCLYLWVVTHQAARPEPEDVIAEYQAWKQQHPPPAEDDRKDS